MASFLTDSWNDIEKFFSLNGKTTANKSGMTPEQARLAVGAATANNIGMLTSVFGGITSAIGQFYAAKSQQYQIKSQASSLQFQSNMDAINARQAEMSAQSIEEAGKTQVQQYTFQAGQRKAATQVGTAARGVDLSSGSAVNLRASDEYAKQVDVLTISANATRSAASQRTQATNYANQSLLTRTSAQNLSSSADSISPGFAAATSLIGSAGAFASKWDYRRRVQLAAGGY